MNMKFKSFLLCLTVAICQIQTSAAAEKKETSNQTNSNRNIIKLEDGLPQKSLHPSIVIMKEKMADFSRLDKKQQEKVVEITKEEKPEKEDKKAEATQEKDRVFKVVTPDDVIKSLEGFGVNSNNIKVSNRDIHDIVIRFICSKNQKVINIDNKEIEKQELKEKILTSCL